MEDSSILDLRPWRNTFVLSEQKLTQVNRQMWLVGLKNKRHLNVKALVAEISQISYKLDHSSNSCVAHGSSFSGANTVIAMAGFWMSE